MKTPLHFPTLSNLGLALLLAAPIQSYAGDRPERTPIVTAVSGQSDWSLVSIDPAYITSDGTSITIRDMPLAGRFALAGDGTVVEATIKGILDADLDMSGTGQIYGPLVLTQRVRGHEVPIFHGRFFGRTDQWLASGQILLHGRGRFAGMTIAVSFVETGPDTETFTLTGHLFDPRAD
jgi:hypothetical protein